MQVLRDVGGKGVARVEVELDGGKPRSDDLACPLRVGGRFGCGAGVAIGIDPNTIAVAAAEEVVDGGVQRPSDEIPERDLDTTDGGDRSAGQRALAGEAANHQVVKLADIVWVLADDDRRGLVHELSDAYAPIGFSEAGYTFVGLDLDEHPRKVALDHRRAHPRD